MAYQGGGLSPGMSLAEFTASFAIPSADVVTNVDIADVVGNKEDAASEAVGTASLVALSRQVLSDLDSLDLTVPAADAVANVDIADVVGNKEDAGSLAADIASLVALARMAAKEAWEADKHIHNHEYWYGLHASYSSGVTCGSRTSMLPFILTSGDNTYGPWLCLLGTTDLAAVPGSPTHYDPHRYRYYDSDEKETVHRLQFAVGADVAAVNAAVAAGEVSEDMPIPETDKKRGTPVGIIEDREPIASPLWARVWVAGEDAKAFKIFIGTHYYTDPDT